MKNRPNMLSVLLAAVVFIALTICVFVRTFAPAVLIPNLDIPNMVLLSLVALLLDHYLVRDVKRCYVCVFVFGALTFGLLPFAACFVGRLESLKLGLIGGVTFTVTTWLFSSVQERLSSGPACGAAPILSATGLYLASQCLMGVL